VPFAGEDVLEALVLEVQGFGLAFCAGEVYVGETDVDVGLLVGVEIVLDHFLALQDVCHPAFNLKLPRHHSHLTIITIHKQPDNPLTMFDLHLAGRIIF